MNNPNQTSSMNENNSLVNKSVSFLSPPAMENWVKKIWYWRTHLDIFVEEYLGAKDSLDTADDKNVNQIELYPFQHTVIRAYGNCRDIKDVESRSLGKTWKAGIGLSALAILYPGSPILAVSRTIAQAKEVIRHIDNLAKTNKNLAREIVFPILIQKDYARVNFKDSSYIEARAMNKDGSNLRGWHGKVVYLDESCFINGDILNNVIKPMLKYQRSVAWRKAQQGFKDYPSKLIETTSAYLKSTEFFTRFVDAARDIANGARDKFICAIPCQAGLDYAIFSAEELEEERRKDPSTFDMEYGARFCGAVNGSYYPYDLVMPCRTLEKVELHQPKGSKSDYILSLDVATSSRTGADNAAIVIGKLIPQQNGSYYVHIVYIRTYHGKNQKYLAEEVRRLCIHFPNIIKVVIDVNAIGEGVVTMLGLPYVDENDKEYPPFLSDTITDPGNGIPIIFEYRGDNAKNNKGATTLKRYLEDKYILLPLPATEIRKEKENAAGKNAGRLEEINRALLLEEMSVYVNADALQIELGNIRPIPIASGLKFDTVALHKDRYSALMMLIYYVGLLEDKNIEEYKNEGADECLAIACSW